MPAPVSTAACEATLPAFTLNTSNLDQIISYCESTLSAPPTLASTKSLSDHQALTRQYVEDSLCAVAKSIHDSAEQVLSQLDTQLNAVTQLTLRVDATRSRLQHLNQSVAAQYWQQQIASRSVTQQQQLTTSKRCVQLTGKALPFCARMAAAAAANSESSGAAGAAAAPPSMKLDFGQLANVGLDLQTELRKKPKSWLIAQDQEQANIEAQQQQQPRGSISVQQPPPQPPPPQLHVSPFSAVSTTQPMSTHAPAFHSTPQSAHSLDQSLNSTVVTPQIHDASMSMYDGAPPPHSGVTSASPPIRSSVIGRLSSGSSGAAPSKMDGLRGIGNRIAAESDAAAASNNDSPMTQPVVSTSAPPPPPLASSMPRGSFAHSSAQPPPPPPSAAQAALALSSEVSEADSGLMNLTITGPSAPLPPPLPAGAMRGSYSSDTLSRDRSPSSSQPAPPPLPPPGGSGNNSARPTPRGSTSALPPPMPTNQSGSLSARGSSSFGAAAAALAAKLQTSAPPPLAQSSQPPSANASHARTPSDHKSSVPNAPPAPLMQVPTAPPAPPAPTAPAAPPAPTLSAPQGGKKASVSSSSGGGGGRGALLADISAGRKLKKVGPPVEKNDLAGSVQGAPRTASVSVPPTRGGGPVPAARGSLASSGSGMSMQEEMAARLAKRQGGTMRAPSAAATGQAAVPQAAVPAANGPSHPPPPPPSGPGSPPMPARPRPRPQ